MDLFAVCCPVLYSEKIFFLLSCTTQAEHHARALQNLPGISFFRDERRSRIGILTTLPIKHAMCTLTNAMLRENRICCTSGDNFVSKNCKELEIKALLRDELQTYSYQFKTAATVFNREQVFYCLFSASSQLF